MTAVNLKRIIIAAVCLMGMMPSAYADNVWGSSPNSLTRQIHRPHHLPGWQRERPHRGNGYVQTREHQHGSQNHRPRDRVGGNGLPSYVQGVGTFAGGLSAVRFRKNGIYFFADGLGGAVAQDEQARARIIEVSPGKAAGRIPSACSMEHGVCVVRGSP